jgi:hypothetical protein
LQKNKTINAHFHITATELPTNARFLIPTSGIIRVNQCPLILQLCRAAPARHGRDRDLRYEKLLLNLIITPM